MVVELFEEFRRDADLSDEVAQQVLRVFADVQLNWKTANEFNMDLMIASAVRSGSPDEAMTEHERVGNSMSRALEEEMLDALRAILTPEQMKILGGHSYCGGSHMIGLAEAFEVVPAPPRR